MVLAVCVCPRKQSNITVAVYLYCKQNHNPYDGCFQATDRVELRLLEESCTIEVLHNAFASWPSFGVPIVTNKDTAMQNSVYRKFYCCFSKTCYYDERRLY